MRNPDDKGSDKKRDERLNEIGYKRGRVGWELRCENKDMKGMGWEWVGEKNEMRRMGCEWRYKMDGMRRMRLNGSCSIHNIDRVGRF